MTNEMLNAKRRHKVSMTRDLPRAGAESENASKQAIAVCTVVEKAAMVLGTEIGGLGKGRLMQGTSCSSRCRARAVEAMQRLEGRDGNDGRW
jgi:hypothetical protein